MPFDDHDQSESAFVSLTIVPGAAATSFAQPVDGAQELSGSMIQDLFAAVSACANLHPDPTSEGDSPGVYGEVDQVEDGDEPGDSPNYDCEVTSRGSLPPPLPGSGGWITSENVDQFFDSEGNWRGAGMGPGAGLVRGREEEDEEADADEDTKWRRTA
jgi:nucleotide-sensitive chloride channel 1A